MPARKSTVPATGRGRKSTAPAATGRGRKSAAPTTVTAPAAKGGKSTAGTKRQARQVEEPKPKRRKISHETHRSRPGCVLALGQGDVGQLGLGEDVLEKSKPGLVEAVGDDIIQVVAGGMHTACLSAKGEVFTFGCNDEFALGRLTTIEGSETTPGKVDLKHKIVQISGGDSHTACLSEDGNVIAWGTFRDANGSIGLTASGKREPSPIEFLMDKAVIKIASGSDHLVCLTEEGDIYTTGNADQGQLGRVAECFSQRGGRKGLRCLLDPSIVHVKKVRGKKVQFCDIWAGAYHTFAEAKDSGDIYAWGLNNYHQLGIPDMENKFMPERAPSFKEASAGWKALACGLHHSIALDGDGQVYAIGRPEYGRLGMGEIKGDLKVPTPIPTLKGIKCTDITCGPAVSLALADNGKVYGWGMSTSMQTGHGDEDDILVPTIMPGKQLQNRSALMVSAGGQHTVVLAMDALPNGDAH